MAHYLTAGAIAGLSWLLLAFTIAHAQLTGATHPVKPRAAQRAVAARTETPIASSYDDQNLRRGPQVTLEWYRAIFGYKIGRRGLSIADLDGDGRTEVVLAAMCGSRHYWYTLQCGATDYEHVWVSPLYEDLLRCVRTANVDGDDDIDVCVAVGTQILVYDGASLEVAAVVDTAGQTVRGLNIVDVDSDDELEFVFCDNDHLYVYNVASGLEEYAGAGFGGDDVAVGNVDEDADLEIVVGDGREESWVLNGVTHAVEWAYESGFGYYTRVGDLDEDGMDEIAAGYRTLNILVLDADLQSPKYEIPVDLDLDALRIADVEGDGPLEIVWGDGQWGKVYVHDGASGALKWSVTNPRDGVTDVAVGDSDGDGVNELLWGAGHSSGGPDYLYVVDTITREIEWQSYDISGPFYGLDHGDVDDDGEPELLYGCYLSDSGYGDGLYFVHDALTKELEYMSDEPTGLNWTGLWRVRQANVDDDPQAEIFITTSRTYQPLIICYDGITHEEQWGTAYLEGDSAQAMDVGDVDGDGVTEIVVGAGGYLYVFGGATGAEEWRSVYLGTYGSLALLRLADVDDDANLEMVVASYDGQVVICDGVTHVQELQTADFDITALDTADLNGDGVSEVIVGTDDGAIEVLDVETGQPSETIGNFGGRIDGLDVVDIAGGKWLDYIFCVDNRLFIHYDDPSSEPVSQWPPEPTFATWRRDVIGTSVGRYDSLVVADVDEDGTVEIVVSIGGVGLKVYAVEAPTSSALQNCGGSPVRFR